MSRLLGETRSMDLGPDMSLDWFHDGNKITMTVFGPGSTATATTSLPLGKGQG
jgi:hypothetical protein